MPVPCPELSSSSRSRSGSVGVAPILTLDEVALQVAQDVGRGRLVLRVVAGVEVGDTGPRFGEDHRAAGPLQLRVARPEVPGEAGADRLAPTVVLVHRLALLPQPEALLQVARQAPVRIVVGEDGVDQVGLGEHDVSGVDAELACNLGVRLIPGRGVLLQPDSEPLRTAIDGEAHRRPASLIERFELGPPGRGHQPVGRTDLGQDHSGPTRVDHLATASLAFVFGSNLVGAIGRRIHCRI